MKTRSITFVAYIVFACLLCLPVMASAQWSMDEGGPSFSSKLIQPGFSLWDPDRMSLTQSYSMSYFSSNRGSGSIGMLMNSIEYQVSNPLSITLDLGLMHSPSALIGRADNGLSPTVVPGIRLRYRPSENFFLGFDFRSNPRGYGYGDYYPSYFGGSSNWGRK